MEHLLQAGAYGEVGPTGLVVGGGRAHGGRARAESITGHEQHPWSMRGIAEQRHGPDGRLGLRDPTHSRFNHVRGL